MSVFSAGCTLEAAEKVCRGDGVEAHDVLDLIERLVDKSLLTTTVTAGEVRYGMLETIHRFATDRLTDHGDPGIWHQRHAHHYARFAETARRPAETVSLLPTLRADHANLIAAMTALYDAGEYRRTGVMAAALYSYWLFVGLSQEASDWYERLIDLDVDWTPKTRGELLQGAGTFRSLRDPTDAEALAWLEEALDLRVEHGLFLWNSLINLGDAAMRRGDLDAAAEYLERLATYRDPSSRSIWDHVYLHANLAEVAFLAGQPEEAVTYLETILEAGGGDPVERQQLDEVLRAGLERWEGNLEAARHRIESWQDVVQGVYARTDTEALFDIQMAALERDEGHPDRAEPHLVRAAEVLIPKGWWLEGLLALWATVSAAQGRMERAARLLGAAEAEGRYLYLPMHHPDEIDLYRTQTEQALGTDYDRLHAEGVAMSIPDAVGYAHTGRDEP